MNRDLRTTIVLLVAVVTAGLASFGVYQWIKSIPVREVEVAHAFVVTAARPLPMGTKIEPADLKLVAWPRRSPVPGSHTSTDTLVNRGVVDMIQENEPITDAKLAPLEAGAGLSPTIPEGMRAISVRVNEVIGVAGFVTPGTRVDVFATLQQPTGSQTRVVVSNVQVLTAGTRYDQDKSKASDPIPSSVVTLLLSPADAERVVLASTEGQIMLALRNPLDVAPTETAGTRMTTLFGDTVPAPRPAPMPRPVVVQSKQIAAVPPPPPAPKPYTVEAIRGARRSDEVVRSEAEAHTP